MYQNQIAGSLNLMLKPFSLTPTSCQRPDDIAKVYKQWKKNCLYLIEEEKLLSNQSEEKVQWKQANKLQCSWSMWHEC